MKICPACSFSNEERFPTCVYCNANIVDVPSIPAADPNAPEHEQRVILAKRYQRTRSQLRFATIAYALSITVTALYPGLILSLLPLLLYAVSALVVALAVHTDLAGQFTASFLQGALSVVLLSFFGPLQPFIFFMIATHLMLPALFWHWVDMIHGANR